MWQVSKSKDLLWAALGLSIFVGGLVYMNRQKQPEPVVIELKSDASSSPEHAMVQQALLAPDSIVQEDTLSEVVPVSELTQVATPELPVKGEPLPIAWESRPAPEASDVKLSASLERSLAASADLRTDEYTNPSSELNLESIASLRAIREQRQGQ